ncbi:putative ion transporter superfamily protein YfcC [Actinocorallia herbida]|uniref:Putative ion transporter superfamily protein YfcC n=1 Tax=Actinocorallia herbida TaxID=58109 RepID=A0A3N1D1J1_9ACTN|nr:SLC13 family permease [Actinocorallia herbida]ROO86928.1 putative ion transporter superfamily protein YfcC [Actinocorallia herbida]
MALTLAPPPTVRGRVQLGVSAVLLAVSFAAGLTAEAPTAWGLLPIGVYAALAIGGLNLVGATFVALLSGLLLARPAPVDAATTLLGAFGDSVFFIGVLCALGSALGEILRRTGGAALLVRRVLRMFPADGRSAIALGVMTSALVLVFALGTLAGALAVIAPLVVPVAARAGLTRSTTATALLLGAGAGLATAPFSPANIAIFDATGISYPLFLLVCGLPLALLSYLVAFLVLPRIQRASARDDGDRYAEADGTGEAEGEALPATAGRAAVAFAAALAVAVLAASITRAGALFPIVALPVMTIVTALAARMPAREALAGFWDGFRRVLAIVALFWMLAVLFDLVTVLDPYAILMDDLSGSLAGLSAYAFALAVALLGWVAVPGATAAQIVLIHQIFGPLGDAVGLSAPAWAVVYLWGSKADTYGPFPNPNMVVALGVAQGIRLRTLLLVGWAVLVPGAVMYAAILTLLT